MDTYQARRQNLIGLIEAEFAGNQTAFAAKVGVKPPQVNRWVSDTASDKRRINEDSARRIEDACGKDHGWLDYVDLVPPDPKALPPVADDFALVLKAWGVADEANRAVVIAWAKAILATR